MLSQGFQNFCLTQICASFLRILSISHIVDDAVDGLMGRLAHQVVAVCLQSCTLLPRPGTEHRALGEKLQNGHPFPFTASCGFHRRYPTDAGPQFIINIQEKTAMTGLIGEADDVADVPHHSVGKEAAVHLSAAIAGSLALEEVNERNCTVIVSI